MPAPRRAQEPGRSPAPRRFVPGRRGSDFAWRLLRRALPLAAGLALLGCAAERDHSEGMQAMNSGDREHGLTLLAKASQAEPSNSQYRLDFLQQQALTEREALTRGDDARRLGRLDDARQWYQLALRVNPASDRALRGVSNVEMDGRHVTALVEVTGLMDAGKFEEARDLLHKVLLENSANVAAQKLWTQLAEKQEAAELAQQAQIRATSVMKKPVSLQFRDANLRLVFEALSRTTGLNVIFDRDVKADLKTTIFVRDASVEDTVDMILLQSQLEKKVLNANTLFIYPSTSAKQKEYQDLKIRVFQLSNVDGKYMQTVLKTVLKSADLSLDEKSNTLVVRGTPDMIGVAEKLIAAHDLPDPEVMLEVEVLEVSRDRLTDLGIQWPTSLAVATPGTDTTLSNLNHQTLSGLTVSSLQATLNLALTDTDTNILASPRIRVRDKQKAKILIGDKVPVFTNSVTPTATTSVVTGTVTYLDVGIKLDVEPHVYLEGDVGINLNIEVSNIVKEISNAVSGSVAYQIGTRSAQTSLRLRDGETQILAGLIEDQTNATTNAVPGLGQFPILGRLFSNDNRDHSKDEIVLSITPHILRAPAIADRRVREIFSGTESTVRENPLRLDPVGSVSNSTGTPAAPAAPAAPVVPGFVGGGGNPTAPASAISNESPAAATDPRVNAATMRHQRPPAGTPWPPGNTSSGDAGASAAPPAPEAPAPAPEAPAPAPADAPPPAPPPSAGAPAPAPAAPALQPPVTIN
jgi:general secretion pathway protein D